MACVDTSFLCGLYIDQSHSSSVDRLVKQYPSQIFVTTVVKVEFEQSLRWQNWLYHQDKAKGQPNHIAQGALQAFERNLTEGLITLIESDWNRVAKMTERLSITHTAKNGCRLIDIMIVASVLLTPQKEFLTFDTAQAALARAEGLKVPRL
jgi:predicted nucleic acid-binding protein